MSSFHFSRFLSAKITNINKHLWPCQGEVGSSDTGVHTDTHEHTEQQTVSYLYGLLENYTGNDFLPINFYLTNKNIDRGHILAKVSH